MYCQKNRKFGLGYTDRLEIKSQLSVRITAGNLKNLHKALTWDNLIF